MIAPVPLAKAYRLLNHGPVVLVSSAHGATRNLMAAAWSMPLDFDPPKVAVVIDKSSYTRELVDASGEFVLSLPCRQLAEATLAVGTRSGRTGDKFDALGLATRASGVVAAPGVAGCVGWLECRVIPEPANQQRYDLFVAEVVAAAADTRVFTDGRWHFDDVTLRTLHYVAGGHFLVSGEALEVGA